MKAEGFTQGDVGKLLRKSRSAMSRILAGKRRASVDTLFRMSQMSGIPMEMLAVAFHGKRVA